MTRLVEGKEWHQLEGKKSAESSAKKRFFFAKEDTARQNVYFQGYEAAKNLVAKLTASGKRRRLSLDDSITLTRKKAGGHAI